MEIKKGIRPGTEMRCELLKILGERNVSLSMQAELTEPMRGKSEEEKERIAAEIIQKIEAGEIT